MVGGILKVYNRGLISALLKLSNLNSSKASCQFAGIGIESGCLCSFYGTFTLDS